LSGVVVVGRHHDGKTIVQHLCEHLHFRQRLNSCDQVFDLQT
jgi:hypothetical protein